MCLKLLNIEHNNYTVHRVPYFTNSFYLHGRSKGNDSRATQLKFVCPRISHYASHSGIMPACQLQSIAFCGQ